MDSLDGKISDEELRNRIREYLPQKEKSPFEKFSKHPAFLILLSFLFTFIIGGYINNNIQNSNYERDQQNLNRKLTLESISEISNLMYKRIHLSSVLASSLKRKAKFDEIKKRKLDYDEVYIEWNSKLQSVQLKIREITNSNTYSKIESHIQFGLVPNFRKIDSYLTTLYDYTTNNDEYVYGDLLGTEIQNCVDCAYVITQYLWTETNYKKDTMLIKNALKELEQRCPITK